MLALPMMMNKDILEGRPFIFCILITKASTLLLRTFPTMIQAADAFLGNNRRPARFHSSVFRHATDVLDKSDGCQMQQ